MKAIPAEMKELDAAEAQELLAALYSMVKEIKEA
jgi:hypothetical protein